MKKILFISLLFAFSGIVKAQGPIMYLPFNGNPNDESGNGNNGTVNGATLTTDRFGNTNSAYSFNGTSDFILVNNSSTFPSTAITIAFWFNRMGITPGTDTDHYISKEEAFSAHLEPSNILYSQVWKGSAGGWSDWPSGAYTVQNNSDWVFYASTFDNASKTVKIYINGQLVNTVNETDPNAILRTSIQPLYIGRNGSSSVYFINGKMDDISIYDRVLTESEILALYGDSLVPTITAFNPTTGTVGSSVTITGTNFSTTPGNNIVRFGATKATVTAATTTQLTVTVPAGATFAAITVTTNNLTTYSQKFFMPTFNGTGVLNSSSFAAKVDFTTAQGESYFTTLADFDGDGKPDLAVANYTPSTSTVSVFRNTATFGAITAGSFATKIDLAAGERPAGVAVGDLDGDTKLDLVVVNQTSNTISVFRNSSNSTGNITFSSKVDFATTSNPATVAISDLDADGKPEVIVANNGGISVSVFKNTSVLGSITTGSFATKQDFTTGPNPLHINVGDLDGDGKPDLVTANGDNTVCILRNTSVQGIINSSSFATKVNFPTGNGSINVAIGDIDGDGKQDLALTNLHAATLSVLRNTSSPGTITASSFAAKVDFSTGTRPIGVSMGDLDGDGKLDIAVACEGTNTVSVYKSKVTSGVLDVNSFAAKVDYSKTGLSYEVTIGDIDGDGKPELVVGNGVNSVSVLHNRSSTTTTPLFYYNFDDQVNDQTLNNHNGTTQGTPVYVASTPGRGKAASFNDTWRIVVNNSKPSDFALNGAWTIAFSLKPETTVDWGNGFLQRIGDDGTCNRRGPILLINNNTTVIPPICGFHGTDYFDGNGMADNPSITGLQTGSWNRLIFVHRADNTGDIYMNGIKIHNNISMKVADFGTKLMSIGGNYLNDGCYSEDYANNVMLDDFSLFNTELSGSEISSDGLTSPVGGSNSQSPIPTITSTATDPTNLLPFPINITFSKSVTGFVVGDITVTNGSIGSFTGSGTTYTASVTPTAQGAVTVTVAANVAIDAASNGNVASNILSRIYDNIAPMVAITSTSKEATSDSPIPVTFIFSESVTGFVAGDITVTNGSIANFTGSGTTYTASITPTVQGAVTATVAANVAIDAASNGNVASNILPRVYDNTAPMVAITSTSKEATSDSPIPVTFIFSESVTGFVAGDITVTNGSIGSFTGSGTTYTASITPTVQGAVTVTVAANVAIDAASNGNVASNILSRVYDNSPSVLDSNNSDNVVTTGSVINVTARFSDPQTNVTSAQLFYRAVTKSTVVKSIMLAKTGTDWIGSIPSSDIGELGIEYKFEVINGAGLIFTTPYKLIKVKYSAFTIPYSSFGSKLSNFRMISIPLDLDGSSVNNVFNDELGAYDKLKWRLFHYKSTTKELDGSTILKPGEGYWLIAKNNPGFNLQTDEGLSVETTPDNPFSINLIQGWNQIGNPYHFDLSWNDILNDDKNKDLKAAMPKFWIFEGSYSNSSTELKNGAGAFINVVSPVSLYFPVTKNLSINSGRIFNQNAHKPENSIDSENWGVNFTLEQGSINNDYSGLGMNTSALIEYDKFDDVTPPRLFDFLELNHEKKVNSNPLVKDIVPTSESNIWSFHVESSDDKALTRISWDNSYFGINEKEIYFIDESEKISLNMRSMNSYEFTTPRNFRVVYGGIKLISKEIPDGIGKILSVSPNPSDGEAKIMISIPGLNKSHSLRIEILNLLGTSISTIFSGTLPSGTHELLWNVKTLSSDKPAQGTYFVRMICSGHQSIHRIIIK